MSIEVEIHRLAMQLSVEAARVEGFLRGLAINPELSESLRSEAKSLADRLQVVQTGKAKG